MYSRKDPCAHHRKNGHGLGRSVDRSAPFLPKQKQHSRDQSPRVANTDPKDEIDNRPTPRDWTVQTPDTHAGRDQVANVDWAKEHHQTSAASPLASKFSAPGALEISAAAPSHLSAPNVDCVVCDVYVACVACAAYAVCAVCVACEACVAGEVCVACVACVAYEACAACASNRMVWVVDAEGSTSQ